MLQPYSAWLSPPAAQVVEMHLAAPAHRLSAQQLNQQPVIDSISLGCDLVLDSIGLSAGSTTNFTLFVDDESPLTLTLTFFIDSDDPSVSTPTVSEDGVFTLVGVTAGEKTMPIIVTDEHGLSSQLLLSVVVDEA